jgi:hypothetical protein
MESRKNDIKTINMMEVLMREELIIEVWSGNSTQKHAQAYLGRSNKDNYYLLTGSRTSSVENDAPTISNSVLTILCNLRLHNPPQPDGTHILVNDFQIKDGTMIKAWNVAFGSTIGTHSWIEQHEHL